jgi:hypothetical protein
MIAIVFCGLVSFWSWEAVSEIQGALWTAVLPSSGPDFRSMDFSMCGQANQANSISDMLGCMFLTIVGHVCLWFFVSVLFGAVRLPFILWHILGKLGMSMHSRPIFWLLAIVLLILSFWLMLMHSRPIF